MMKVVVVLALVGAFLAYILITNNQREKRMTAMTTATVTGVQFKKDIESSSLDETWIDYRFAASGQEVQGNDSLPGDKTGQYSPGRTIMICYNPSDPQESAIETAPAPKCGS